MCPDDDEPFVVELVEPVPLVVVDVLDEFDELDDPVVLVFEVSSFPEVAACWA